MSRKHCIYAHQRLPIMGIHRESRALTRATLDEHTPGNGFRDFMGARTRATAHRDCEADHGAGADASLQDFKIGKRRWQESAGTVVVTIVGQTVVYDIGWGVNQTGHGKLERAHGYL